MTVLLAPLAVQKFFDNNGVPAVKAQVFTYLAGTSTKTATYVDAAGITPNTNPIILNARGECNLWLDTSKNYKFVFSPATDTDPPTNAFWTVDNIPGAYGGTILYTQLLYPQTLAEAAKTITPVQYFYWPAQNPGFGVMPDRFVVNSIPGTTNMTSAINGAISTAPAGYGVTILIPPPPLTGSYLCDQITIPASASVIFKGSARTGSILASTVTTTSFFKCAGDLNYCRFEDIEIQPSGAHTAGWCFDFQQATLASAKTVSAATAASPGVFTSNGHGLSNGDVVYASGFSGGTWGTLNDLYFTIAGAAANTFNLANPNSQNLDTSGLGVFSAGQVQKISAPNVVRDFGLKNSIITGFANGMRLGQCLNTNIGEGNRILRVQGAGIGVQVGDSGFIATSTKIGAYIIGFDTACIWNKNCTGLKMDAAIAESAIVGLRNDFPCNGTMHQEVVTKSITGTAMVQLTALNDLSSWGTINAGNEWSSAAQQKSRIRTTWQSLASVYRSTNLTETADNTYRTMIFNSALYNTDGDFNTTTGVWTAKVPALYRFKMQVTMSSITVANTVGWRLICNGASVEEVLGVAETTQANPTFIRILEKVFFMAAGQTATIEHKGSAANDMLGNAGATATWLTIEQIN